MAQISTSHAPVPAASGRKRSAYPISLLLTYLVLGLFILTPFVLMVVASFKATTFETNAARLFQIENTLNNYRKLFSISLFWRWLWNSIVTTVVPTAVSVLFSALLGFIFAKKDFPGREVIFWAFMATLMVPSQVRLIPNFILYRYLGFINTYWVFIVPGLWGASAFFMMRQFIRTIPDALLEAAKIDGASDWKTFLYIILPGSRPALATLATFGFINHWNDLMTPLIFASAERMRTLTLAFATMLTQDGNLGVQMAGATINFIPTFLVFLVARKQFIQGINLGAVKG